MGYGSPLGVPWGRRRFQRRAPFVPKSPSLLRSDLQFDDDIPDLGAVFEENERGRRDLPGPVGPTAPTGGDRAEYIRRVVAPHPTLVANGVEVATLSHAMYRGDPHAKLPGDRAAGQATTPRARQGRRLSHHGSRHRSFRLTLQGMRSAT